MSVKQYSDHELVHRAVMNAVAHTTVDSPRWVAVMDTFALGSTFARELCELHGVDPDELKRSIGCAECNR